MCCLHCGTRTRAAFPTAVAGPIQYGPCLQALVAYLRYAQHLPGARLARLLRERHGVALATGTVANLCRRVADRLATDGDRLRDQALAIPVACMDESLDIATAVVEGSTDPTWNNADANLQRPDWGANTYLLDATVPWLRTQDQPDDTVLKA